MRNPAAATALKTTATAFLCAAALAAAACSGPAQPGFTPADATAIRQRTQEFKTAFNAKDPDKLTVFYPAEAVLMPPNAPTVRGKDSIRDFFKELYAQGGTDLNMETRDVRGQGTMAYEAGTYSLNRRPATGSATRDRGKYLIIWRQQNGTWTIESTIWSSDLPEAVPLAN
jgi:ketosteroid isomerase-like protein